MNLRRMSLNDLTEGTNRATAHYSRLQVRMLTVGQFDPLVSLRKRVISALDHPDLYVPEVDEQAFIDAHCGSRGESIGVFSGRDLVAYAMLGLPEDRDSDATEEIFFNLDTATLKRTGYLSSCMVLPGFRGLGIQRALISSRQMLAKVLGRDQCMAIVSPYNHISRQNLFEADLRIVAASKVGGRMRQIMSSSPKTTAASEWVDLTSVQADDIETQQNLLQRGFHGVAQTCCDDQITLVFGRQSIVA